MFLFLLLADFFLLSSPFQLRPCSVTTVDSGSKALELLGLRDEAAESSSPSSSSSSPDHQVINLLFGGLVSLCSGPVCDQAITCLPASLLLQEIDVNLIITDYCMPGMTGYDLLRRVKVRFAHGLKFLSRVGAFTNNHGPQPRVKFSSLICLPTLESRDPPR